MTIKALETHYAGCRFRSRLEARWAVFFDRLDIAWQYEPQGFSTPAGPYLPDFLLTDDNMWIEVKGGPPSTRDIERVSHFAAERHEAGQRFAVLQGDIPAAPRFDRNQGPLGVPILMWHTYETTGNTSHPLLGMVEGGDVPPVMHYLGAPAPDGLHDFQGFVDGYWMPKQWPKLPLALKAARSARFEHGQCG